MQECKFKVGDVVKRVRYVDSSSRSPDNGEPWKISGIEYREGGWYLGFEGCVSGIIWEAERFTFVSRAEEQKKTSTELLEGHDVTAPIPEDVAAFIGEKQQTQWTDKHYDAYYTLTQKDVEAGKVKIDPYFVAKQWRLGEKDDTGVLFHNLKNISRYGEKNSKEREIKALHAQIKRLAEIEGVEL